MKLIPEHVSSTLITEELAYRAARDALIAAASGGVTIFPAVLAHASSPLNRFSVKSGTTPNLTGLKVGSYWTGNEALGIPRHHSTILLLDQETGRIAWVIEAGTVNAFRTAAVDAVAADMLARPDASVLAIFGAGHQAAYECRAISRIRPIREILVVARHPVSAEKLVSTLRAEGYSARASVAKEACAQADSVVTATAARAPLFDSEWIRPGTHVASMGSDASGKQELPPTLFDRCELYCDFPAQAVVMGELQHYQGDKSRISPIGDVLSGGRFGRTTVEQITFFDSSGISLQDLYVGKYLVDAFEQQVRAGE